MTLADVHETIKFAAKRLQRSSACVCACRCVFATAHPATVAIKVLRQPDTRLQMGPRAWIKIKVSKSRREANIPGQRQESKKGKGGGAWLK